MNPNAPIPFSELPSFREGTSLASVRDDRNVSKQWKHNKATIEYLAQAMDSVQKSVGTLSRQKRVRYGGGITSPPSGVSFKGTYDNTKSYLIGDIVIIEPWDTACTAGVYDTYQSAVIHSGTLTKAYPMPGIYLCIKKTGTGTVSAITTYNVPQNPPPYTILTHTAGDPYDWSDAQIYWVMISDYPIQQYVVHTLSNADYYLANTWDGTTIGTKDIYIAKNKRQRPSVSSEIIDSTTVTYSSYTSDNTRTASDGTNTEYQVVYPRFKAHGGTLGGTNPDTLSIISACVPALGTGVSHSGVPVFLEEIKPARVWARRYVQ